MRIYKTIILPVVLYGCDSKRGHRLRVSENRVLRIFGPKRDEVTRNFMICTLHQV
jgi:hypothetical protein